MQSKNYKIHLKGCEILSLITENTLRAELKNPNVVEYAVEKDAIVTPSARQYLADRKIKLVYKGAASDLSADLKDMTGKTMEEKPATFKPKYVHINGGAFEKKPEYMTQIYGNKLVFKDHKRIILRGKLDSLQAKILEVQVKCKDLKETKVLNELEETLSFVRKVMAAEILGKEFDFTDLIGFNSDELRSYSHNPKKYFNTEHIIYPSYEMGQIVISLNALRAEVREVEIVAYQTFKNDDGESTRPDIALALNRLSSCFYIMMCKYAAGMYK